MSALDRFSEATRAWFTGAFVQPTPAQDGAWDAISPEAVLSAKLITARCDEGVGASRLVGVRLAGRAIQAGTSPNSTVTVPVAGLGGVQVTVNKQVRNPDGTLTVTWLELAGQALGKSQTVAVSSARCAGAPDEAPKPTPVPSDLPVTG